MQHPSGGKHKDSKGVKVALKMRQPVCRSKNSGNAMMCTLSQKFGISICTTQAMQLRPENKKVVAEAEGYKRSVSSLNPYNFILSQHHYFVRRDDTDCSYKQTNECWEDGGIWSLIQLALYSIR